MAEFVVRVDGQWFKVHASTRNEAKLKAAAKAQAKYLKGTRRAHL